MIMILVALSQSKTKVRDGKLDFASLTSAIHTIQYRGGSYVLAPESGFGWWALFTVVATHETTYTKD